MHSDQIYGLKDPNFIDRCSQQHCFLGKKQFNVIGNYDSFFHCSAVLGEVACLTFLFQPAVLLITQKFNNQDLFHIGSVIQVALTNTHVSSHSTIIYCQRKSQSPITKQLV